jgi:hypothetical protein
MIPDASLSRAHSSRFSGVLASVRRSVARTRAVPAAARFEDDSEAIDQVFTPEDRRGTPETVVLHCDGRSMRVERSREATGFTR